MTATPILEMRGISKTFPGVKALEDVSLSVEAGEVHMLLGQNGAGKSTLIKVLCGAVRADRGVFFFDGRQADIRGTADARRHGIAVIFQEFSLVPYLDIAQNIFLGREFRGRLPGFVDRKQMHDHARGLLSTVGLDIDTRTPVHRLGVAQQQVVEIAKALSQRARILVMDEPTAALSDHEIERLFAQISRLKHEGIAIIYISHRLGEVFAIGDRITVLRDGRKIAAMDPRSTAPADLVKMMVGREIDTSFRKRFCEKPGNVVLDVKGLASATGVRRADLVVREGEIVGLAGLVGSGRTELVRAIFGADKAVAGSVRVAGKPPGKDPAASVRLGMALVPENRKTEGVALIRSVEQNLLAAGLRRLFPRRIYAASKARKAAVDLIDRLRIATPTPRRLVQFLSGGNQQKVVIGKWLNAGSKFFIFDEPTRGIDVGAKAEIYGVMEKLVAGGAAVLVISSELAELVAVCDRAYVMRDRTIVGELARHDLTEESILRLAMHHA